MNFENLYNKIVFITGANSGVGFECAKVAFNNNAHVVMLCRNLEKAKRARKLILNVEDSDNLSSSSSSSIDIEKIDLASFKSVRECANRILKKYDRIDVLLNNAGVMLNQRSTTIDGNCTTLQVNFLSHFLLTKLLWPLLSSDARVCNVSSLTHLANILYTSDINMTNVWTIGYKEQAYCQSKLLNLMFSNELQRKLTVCC
jgi:retinol dehydrogenase-12